MRIKDWDNFQHFKDRNPIWIKLYRTLLDDIEWHKLSGDDAKALVMIWLLASEKKGELPEVKELAFRLRLTESKTKQIVAKLSHWLIMSDDGLLSDDLGLDAIEKRRERDREEKRKKREQLVVAKNALEYLNSKASKNYKETETNLSFILERIKEGYELTDFKKAVENQVTEWGSDEKMNKFLRPSTLFQKSKFDGYVNNTVAGTGKTKELAPSTFKQNHMQELSQMLKASEAHDDLTRPDDQDPNQTIGPLPRSLPQP